MNLHEIITEIKINNNKEYLDDLLRNEKIIEIINDVVKWYKYNKEDVRDIVKLSILEYMNTYEFADNFIEVKFLDSLKRKVSYKTKKMVNGTYKSKEIPFDCIDKVCYMADLSLEAVEDKIDLQLAIKTLDDRERKVFKMYYLEGLNQKEISEKLNFGNQQRVSEVLQNIKEKIKKFF